VLCDAVSLRVRAQARAGVRVYALVQKSAYVPQVQGSAQALDALQLSVQALDALQLSVRGPDALQAQGVRLARG